MLPADGAAPRDASTPPAEPGIHGASETARPAERIERPACDLCGADITDDGTVDFADLLQLLSVYGDCG